MKRMLGLAVFALWIAPLGFAGENIIRLEFSGNTPEANQVSLQPAGFGQFPDAPLTFGSIPTDNAFPGATDGRGVIVTAGPESGVMIFGPVIQTTQLVLARCAVRSSGPNAQVTIATIDMGSNVFVSQNRPENGGYFANQYRRIATLSLPRPAGLQPLIQVFNPSTTDPLTVYLDNFEFIQLAEGTFYNVDFLDGDENDPAVVSIPGGQPQPTPTQPAVPTVTPTVPGTAPTPTWTPTPVTEPSGTAVGLRLTACDPEKPVSLNADNQVFLPVRIDLIDTAGRIVNPGTEGGDSEKEVTVTVSGSALTSQDSNTAVITVDRPDGNTVALWDTAAEEVMVTATSPGLASAAPVKVRFVTAGGIQGLIRAWDGTAYTVPFLVTVSAEVYQSGSQQAVPDARFNMEMDGSYTISGLPAGSYDVQFVPSEPMSIPGLPDDFEIPGFSSIPLQWVCVKGIAVTTGQTTKGINVDLGPRTGGAKLHGLVSRTDGLPVEFATVVLIPEESNTVPCERKEWTAAVMNFEGSADFVPSYSFKEIPAGRYRVQCISIQQDSQATNGEGELITLAAGQDMELNIVVKPILNITPESPIGFRRIGAPVTLQWSVPSGTPPMTYTVSVMDHCMNLIWTQQVTNQTQVNYAGPALSNQDMYTWYVMGASADGSTSGQMMGFTNEAAPEFLVK
ncbi:MAG: hypothetical protein ACE15F_00915 [bacterium]